MIGFDRACPTKGATTDVIACRSLLAALATLVTVLAACKGVHAAPVFTNVTTAAGILHAHTVQGGVEPMTGGAAAGDFDGDGLVDLFFTRPSGTDVLYRNAGDGTFVDISAQAGFTDVVPSSGVAAGDIDNDGDLDLYVNATSHNRFYLYINDGAGHFTEEGAPRGAAVMSSGTSTWRGMGVAMGDYDRDGYLDILTSDHSRPTSNNGARLLHNMGAANPGQFEDVTHAVGLDVYRTPLNQPNTVYRFQPQFTDLDRDGHTDIVFSADDRTSQLFWNNGDNTFTDGTIAAGVGTDKSGMASTLADYDGDGDLDWFITAIFDTPFLGVNPGNRLYRNNGNRTFTDVTTAAGVRDSGSGTEVAWGWGASWMDYDNDADQDLMMTNGWIALGYTGDHTTFRQNNGNGTFTDVTSAVGITDTGQGRGLLRLDYDADGDLDALIVNYAAAPILYRNDGGNEAGHWLRIETEGVHSNRDGIGALITVTPDADLPEDFQFEEIRSGSGYLTSEEMTAHFGLGSFTGTVDRITIEWPSGIVQELHDQPIDSVLHIVEALPGDYNGDWLVDEADLSMWASEAGQSGTGLAADADRNGIVDGDDFLVWQRHLGQSYTAARPSAAAIPEPTSAWLICLGVATGSASFRLRRCRTWFA